MKLLGTIDSQKNLDLVTNIFGDQRRYLQIMINFLSNSLKFTPNGGSVTVHISVDSSQQVLNDDGLEAKIIKNVKNRTFKPDEYGTFVKEMKKSMSF